jgi:hypothetical protein
MRLKANHAPKKASPLFKGKNCREQKISLDRRFSRMQSQTVEPTGMKFRDRQLQQHYDKTVAGLSSCPAKQLRILTLLDAWHWFQLMEGEDSPKVIESVEKLLSPELRPALQAWYQRFGADMNAGELQFRERLSALAGENFGRVTKL